MNEKNMARPCPKCGALIGWISGCGTEGDFDYEPARILTDCFCTMGDDE